MNNLLLNPPVAFLIVLSLVFVLNSLFSKISYKSIKKHSLGSEESYACGEDTYNNLAQPDYSIFFPFAFFFTLAHVGTLIITTVPVETLHSFNMAVVYAIGIIVGLSILLRK